MTSRRVIERRSAAPFAKRVLSVRASQPSCPRRMDVAPGQKRIRRAPASPRWPRRNDASSATMYANASGASRRPSTPDSPKMGRKTSTMMMVANTIDVRISSVASRTTAAAGRCSAGGLRRVLAQPSHDVLDVDDRVVHERADRDRHAAERHRVDASRRTPAARGRRPPATAASPSA